MAYIYDLTDTWSAAGTVFNGIKLNVTNTASASGSKLVTLQIGGTEHFSVTKDGVGYFSGNVGIGTSSPYAKLGIVQTTAGYGGWKYGISLDATDYPALRLLATTGNTGSLIAHELGSTVFLTGTTATSAGAERMRIDASGQVGIGTSSPTTKLDVNGSIRSGTGTSQALIEPKSILFYNTGVSEGTIRSADDASTFTSVGVTKDVVRLLTSNTERMRIDSSGNLLVGTTSNSLSGTATTFVVNYSGGATHGCNFNQTVSSATYYTQIAFSTAGTVVGEIRSNNTATQYNTSSDARLKHDIIDAPEASSLIDAIQVRSFKWNADNSEQRYGFVAQELVTVAPEAVSQPENPEEMMGVDYSKLVPMLVKEIQSMRLRLAQLEGN